MQEPRPIGDSGRHPTFSGDRVTLAGAPHGACCCGPADGVNAQARAASPCGAWYTTEANFEEVCKLGTHWSMASDSVQLPTRTHAWSSAQGAGHAQ